MADYGGLVGAKEILNIDTFDATHDAELTNGLTWASEKIKVMLQAAGVAVPDAAATGTLLGNAANDLCAYRFQRNIKPDVATLFRIDAIESVSDYINYKRGTGIFKGTAP